MTSARFTATIVTFHPDAALFARAMGSLAAAIARAREAAAISEAHVFVVDNGDATSRRAHGSEPRRRSRSPRRDFGRPRQYRLWTGQQPGAREARFGLPPRDESRRGARSRCACRRHPRDAGRSFHWPPGARRVRRRWRTSIPVQALSLGVGALPARLRAGDAAARLLAIAREIRDARRAGIAALLAGTAGERLLHGRAHSDLPAPGRIRSALLRTEDYDLSLHRPRPRSHSSGSRIVHRRRGGAQGSAPHLWFLRWRGVSSPHGWKSRLGLAPRGSKPSSAHRFIATESRPCRSAMRREIACVARGRRPVRGLS